MSDIRIERVRSPEAVVDKHRGFHHFTDGEGRVTTLTVITVTSQSTL